MEEDLPTGQVPAVGRGTGGRSLGARSALGQSRPSKQEPLAACRLEDDCEPFLTVRGRIWLRRQTNAELLSLPGRCPMAESEVVTLHHLTGHLLIDPF